MPSIIHDSITIISHTGLGMSMFSLGMFGLHSSHILFVLSIYAKQTRDTIGVCAMNTRNGACLFFMSHSLIINVSLNRNIHGITT